MRQPTRRSAAITGLALGLLAGVLAPLGASEPAAAQTDAATPAPANPAMDAAKAAADALGADAVGSIQRDLIWTGDLNAIASGQFGKLTFDAIRAYQRRSQVPDDGILTAAQRASLRKEAGRILSAYGFRLITAQGVTLGYPAKITTKQTASKHGPVYSSTTGNVSVDIFSYPEAEEAYEAIFTRLKTPRAGRKIVYSLMRPDFFVISGTSDGSKFYIRFLKTDADTRGFVIGWDPSLSPDFDRVPVAMANSLVLAGASPALADAAPASGTAASVVPAAAPIASGPPVPLPAGATPAKASGIGFVVSAKGDVLAPAHLVAGCTTVTLADGSAGRVVAGDPINDLALVHLVKPASAAPVVWRLDSLAVSEPLTLVADTGGNIGETPTTVSALAGANGDTRRFVAANPAGGGALFDAKGAFVGLAGTDGSALKALFASAFLRARAIPIATEGGGDPEAAAVTLTCDPSAK